MSLFNTLIGGSKRQPAPARPTTTTAKADISPIHGQLSNPSADSPLAPATHSNRKRPSRAQTDLSSYANPQIISSQSSTSSINKTQSTRWRTGVFSSSLRSSPSASVTSLVEPQNDAPSSTAKPNTRSRSKGSNLVRKGSTSEHEWMEVGDDSSDDDFGNARASPPPKEAPEQGDLKPSSSNKTLAESVILVEDEQKKAQLMAEELSTTKQKLAEMTNQCDTLQQRVQVLEKESKERAAHLKFVKETADAENLRISRAHATEMEAKHREIEKIRESWVALQHHMEGRSKVMGELEREREVLHKEIGSLRKRNRKEEEELKMMRNEVDAANTALRTFRERSRASLEAEAKEKAKLKDQVDELWRQLRELQQQSKERDEQIHQLRGSERSTNDAFHKVQKMVDEKDRMLDDLQRRNSALEKQKEQVQERLVELETEGIETNNSAQRLLAKAKEDYKQEIALAHNRIHDLESQLSSHSTGDRQMRSSLQTARTDAQNAIKLAEERAIEVEQLHQQLDILEKALHAKEEKDLHNSAASRASHVQLEDTIRALREEKEKMKADHALQIYKAKSDVAAASKDGKQQISILEKELSSLREKLRTLRERCEVSEQSRRMLKDQLTRHEEENKKSRRDSSSSISGSTVFNLSSSIIRDPASPTTDQVFKLLQTLNYEIFQSAALLADSLCTIERPSSEDINTNDLIDDETTSLLGPHLLSLVRSQSTAFSLDSYDPYPLQTAIQATLVCCATRVMTAWYPGHWDHSDFLMVTYTRIREAEGATASDTWKAMTRARLRPTTSTVTRIVDFLEDCLNTIFRFAGWPATSSNSPGVPPVAGAVAIESLLREHREKLSALARHSLRLNVILDNVSPQLEPALVEPGSDFDHHLMETDDNSGNRGDDDDEVVSTAEIGLRKVADDVITTRGSSSSRGRMILKPKVVLKSSFDL